MSLPIVAIVGRPNVGKSTLVNRLAENNEAIVHEMRGVTRDRSYHEADWNGRDFKIIDTGGIEMGGDDVFQGSITAQALTAADEADVIIFLVDGQTGVNVPFLPFMAPVRAICSMKSFRCSPRKATKKRRSTPSTLLLSAAPMRASRL